MDLLLLGLSDHQVCVPAEFACAASLLLIQFTTWRHEGVIQERFNGLFEREEKKKRANNEQIHF